MSIDAVVTAVTVIQPGDCIRCSSTAEDPHSKGDECPTCHGASRGSPRVRLHLQPRDRNSLTGQSVLTIKNPPSTDPSWLSTLVGLQLWGGSEYVFAGSSMWARRCGYTQLELIGG